MKHAGKAVDQYLERHAEATAALGATLEGEFAHAVVIPSYGEDESLDRVVASIPARADAPVLAVVNVNARKRSPPAVLAANAAALERLRARYPRERKLGHRCAVHAAPFGRLVLLERTMPSSQGVGLARKYGVDLALGAWSAGRLRGDWIHCTDADALLPPDYFAGPRGDKGGVGGAAMLLDFRHFPAEPRLERSAKIYDAWLRAYVLGLSQAGSPYAFHTIGSTIAVHAEHYAAVRGFPKRSAAEDFYLLNKLAKQGHMLRSGASPIRLAARQSDRVPFGTGRAMRDALSGGEEGLPYFYDLALFRYLRVVLAAAESSIREEGGLEARLRALSLEEGLAAGPVLVSCAALEVGAAVETALASAPSLERRLRAFHGWFDAFRTMKLLHHLRDGGIESQPYADIAPSLGALLEGDDPWTADDRAVLGQTLRELSGPRRGAGSR